MKKYIVIIFFLLFSSIQLRAQEIVTLGQCHEWAVLNSPTFLQQGKYQQLSDIKQLDAIWSYLPKFEINGQATYQDPVLKVETKGGISMPFFSRFSTRLLQIYFRPEHAAL